jgi:hypothetical protein
MGRESTPNLLGDDRANCRDWHLTTIEGKSSKKHLHQAAKLSLSFRVNPRPIREIRVRFFVEMSSISTQSL